jgi:hypothetical protein
MGKRREKSANKKNKVSFVVEERESQSQMIGYLLPLLGLDRETPSYHV